MTELVHIWNRCHACGAQPIAGQRFECESCPAGPDNDLCESCYGAYQRGAVEHPAPGSYAAQTGRIGHVFRAHDGRSPDRYQSWLTVPQHGARAPSVPDGFVVRPEFRAGRESFFGAYAFVVDAEDAAPPLVLTALHVMDEMIKTKAIDCTALPRVVTDVGLYDVFASNWVFAELGSARSMLVLPEARMGEEEPYSDRDIAAFRALPFARVTPGRLAAETPRAGDSIWLAFHRRSSAVRTIEAVVVEATDRTLIFRYTNPDELAPYSSGAPLLDREGAIVGINVGAGWFGGQRFGHANHVTSIRRHLALTTADLRR